MVFFVGACVVEFVSVLEGFFTFLAVGLVAVAELCFVGDYAGVVCHLLCLLVFFAD